MSQLLFAATPPPFAFTPHWSSLETPLVLFMLTVFQYDLPIKYPPRRSCCGMHRHPASMVHTCTLTPTPCIPPTRSHFWVPSVGAQHMPPVNFSHFSHCSLCIVCGGIFNHSRCSGLRGWPREGWTWGPHKRLIFFRVSVP